MSKKTEWFSYEKPSSFMTQETYRSRRNLIAISSIALLFCHNVLNIGSDASFMGISVHFEQNSFFTIERIFCCMILYEIIMFFTRVWTDYGAWADVGKVTGGTFNHAAESITARQSVKRTIAQAHSFFEQFQSQKQALEIQKILAAHEQSMQNLISALQRYNSHSFWRTLFENLFFSCFDVFIPLALGGYALFALSTQ